MDNFLNKALDKNNTIIIPGFGALTITSARTRDIYFIPYLKHDDGTLNQIISEITGNDIESSKLYLKEYVATIIKSLEDYSSFEIINFGRFKKIHSGEIEFEKWSDYHKPEKVKKTQDKINVTLSKKENKENITSRKKQSDKNENIEPITFETYQPEINQNSLDEILKEKIVDEHNIEKNSTIPIKENIQPENEMNLDEVFQEINATYDNQQKILDESNNETFKNSESKNINEEIISDDNPNVIENTIDNNNNNNNKEELKQQTKSKRKPKKIKSENDQKNIKNEIKISDKKKKNKILPWLLIGIAIASGTIAFILHSRKNEKIIVNEKIIHKDNQIVKEVKTEIVDIKKKEKEKENTQNKKLNAKSEDKKKIINSFKRTKTKKEEKNKSIEDQKILTSENKINPNPTSDKKTLTENNEEKKNKRPSKKELKEADEIVTQLNTNKKNSEAVNTIKTTAISKNKDNSKATEKTSDKNLNQSAITTNNSNKNSTTNQTTSIKPPINTNNQNIIKTTNGTSVTTNGTTNNTTTINNTKNTVANSEKTNNKTTSSAQTATQNTTNTKTTNQTNSKTASVQTSNNTKATPTLPSNANPKSSTQQTTALPGGKAGKKIELIAETFKDKGSAEKLANKLKDGGYKNTRIEEKDGQFNVVIDSYNTLSETIKELKKYRSQ